uniref:Reverse transcriptase domain-containing protein n=1 Tax=Cyprinus carpio carpio TaxID=630221 RepID=A0A9J7XFH6_CYPCA
MCTGAIFLDLTKAFDLVDHYLLLDKLYSIGLSRSSLLWFNSYFHHCHQCVSFRGSQSNFTGVDKGIPQGSSLGPLLFSIFINDLPLLPLTCCSGCDIHLYADDTIIYCSKPNIPYINYSLQHDFDSVQQWLSFNKLLLNKAKSYCMLFQKKDRNNLNLHFLDSSPLEN